MKRTDGARVSTWRTARGRVGVAALALAGLSTLVFAPSIAAAAPSPRTATEISTAKNAKLGTILVSDTAIYTLKSGKACTGKCSKTWLAVELPQGVTTATAGTGVDASKLGTVAAADGALQVTYDGKPLYWFAKDKAPGQVRGNVTSKWGKGSAVVTAKAKSTTDTTNPGTGGAGF